MRLNYRGWILEADADATRAAYARAGTGGSEMCRCDPCLNFVLSRGAAYPEEILQLFRQLGVDPVKEGEAYWTHREADGLNHYAGWFHFIGSVIETPPDESFTVRVGSNFTIYFLDESKSPRLEPLRAARVVQIEFEVAIPWVCDRPEPFAQSPRAKL